MKRSTLVYTLFIAALTVIFMAFNGCDTLRFSPTESQKQAAQLGADTTAQIRLNGTSPGSAESVIANESAKTTQTYFGLPKQPPQAPEVVIPQAQADAAKRPDPWEVADSVLAIGLSIAGVVGGASGVKLAREISTAQKKSKALREVITANQNFRDELKMKAANPDETLKAAEILQSLKDINGSIQSPETEVLVTEVKSAMPEKLTASLRPASLKQVPSNQKSRQYDPGTLNSTSAAATLISGMILFNLRAMDKRIAAVELDIKESAKRKDTCRQDFVDKVDYIREITKLESNSIEMLKVLSEIKGSMTVIEQMPKICGSIASQVVGQMQKEVNSNG